MIGNKTGISSFIQQNGIFNEKKGDLFRSKVYTKLLKHFSFINEMKLFINVDHSTDFSINIYTNKTKSKVNFDMISNLFSPLTVDACYSSSGKEPVEGIKDSNNNWNLKGHKDRIVNITNKELKILSLLLDNSEDYLSASLLSLHTKTLLQIITKIYTNNNMYIRDCETILSTHLNETKFEKDGTIKKTSLFPESNSDIVLSGPNVSIANPFFQSMGPKNNKDNYKLIDLLNISKDYSQKTSYKFVKKSIDSLMINPVSPWGEKYLDNYRLVSREFIDPQQERTLLPCIIIPKVYHIYTLIGCMFKNTHELILSSGLWASLPFDFIVKILDKSHFIHQSAKGLPMIKQSPLSRAICCRSLKLNCLTQEYDGLLKAAPDDYFIGETWSKQDPRLAPGRLSDKPRTWNWDFPLRTNYERRQALVEIDVLTSMALGLTLEDLKTIYRLQFHVLQKSEANTWYDQRGRVVFSVSKGLTNLNFTTNGWEAIKNKTSGTVIKTFIDETQPSGPVERTIELFLPFDRCDRERDYDAAWSFFEEKFRKSAPFKPKRS
jgi:hypothetical protein